MPVGCGHMVGAAGAGGQGLLGREGREGHVTLAKGCYINELPKSYAQQSGL